MTGLLYTIFGYSFDALKAYGRNNDGLEGWVETRHQVNYAINENLFRYIVRQHEGEARQNSISQQFYLDTINAVVKKHYNRRLKIYRFTKQKTLFCLVSVVVAWVELMRRLIASLARFNKNVVYDTGAVGREINICIGFPAHAFSYEENGDYEHPRSFAEFLVRNGHTSFPLLSVDEYERGSKKHEGGAVSADLPSSFNRIKCVAHISTAGWRTAFTGIREKMREYRSRIQRGNLFLLTEYLGQSFQERKYGGLFRQLKNAGVRVHSIFFISFLDPGLIKYGSAYDESLSVFSYSQNLFVPPAKKISQLLFTGEMKMDADEILEECEASVLSFYYRHPVGFTGHCHAIDAIKAVLNETYGLSLPRPAIEAAAISVNLGYESFTTLEPYRSGKDVLVFDVPTEKPERDLGRAVAGDKTAKQDFMNAFYKDLLACAERYDARIILKPKYSLSSPEFPASYKQMIQELQAKAGERFLLIDPYTVLRAGKRKIRLSVNFPFTSTYYSMEDVCERSVYYAPSPYEGAFLAGEADKLVLGRESLENIFKYL